MKKNEKPNTMLTVREASKLLNIHVHTLRRWNDQGFVSSYRIGPRCDRRFRLEDITALLCESVKN